MATSLYNLYFKLISGHDPSVMIDIQREMTEEQAKEIAGISSKIIVSPAKRKEEDKDDLYLLIFKGKKDRTIQTIVSYLMMTIIKLCRCQKKFLKRISVLKKLE